VDLDANGQIAWHKTVVYHVWSNAPTQLRMTTFEPRNNSLTPVQRMGQLASVVGCGNGLSTYENTNTQTRVLFENLFDWSLQARGARFDAYSPVVERENVNLGSAILSNGTHQFQFTVIGSNTQSRGCKIGIDSVVVSPCGGDREAEACLPLSGGTQYGAVADRQYMSGGSWNGNYQLLFPATATGHYFILSMPNDRWEERHFRASGSLCEGTVVEFDDSLNPKDFVVRLEGLGYSWYASDQSANLNGSASATNELSGCAVRVLMKGMQMLNGGWVTLDGGKCWVNFRSAWDGLKIDAAYIAECASSTDASMDAVPGSAVQLMFYGSSSCEFSGWVWAGPADFSIDKNKSYLVSFLVSRNPQRGNAWTWVGSPAAVSNSYVIPAACDPGVGDLTTATWSTKTNVVSTNVIYATQWLYTYYRTNGYHTSPVIDTKLTAPAYSQMSWVSDKPGNSTLTLKIRSGNDPTLSDAQAWSNVTAYSSSPAAINPGNKRYFQFRAQLMPDSGGTQTPKLKDVLVTWPGETRLVDISGVFTKGPDYGITEVTVDGKQLARGIQANLTIYEDVRSSGGSSTTRLTSALSMEIEPRNTGK
jgi:hypothetical protein